MEDASIAAGIRDTSARRAAATSRRSACSIPLALLQPTTHLDAVAVGDATAKLVTRDASRVTRL
ncbi:hypothetical protein [Microbacterium sp. CIAB417]|uniref:hypothetical protein n=1 Tax=Microbacterium sp. CIAB417 TaxID=2860287 RepID=UPI001FABDBF7|nr:hypothetical protein [Microbacterium sp. CIAB417]